MNEALLEHLRSAHGFTHEQEQKFLDAARKEGVPPWDRNARVEEYLPERVGRMLKWYHANVHLPDAKREGMAWYFRHARDLEGGYELARDYISVAFRGGWEE